MIRVLEQYWTWIFGAALALICMRLSFNGLYGQDAHEYLRQAQQLYLMWTSEQAASPQIGDREMSVGYPILGALTRFFIPDAIIAMQVVNWVGIGLVIGLFEKILNLYAPGTKPQSRRLYALLGLGLCPIVFRAGLVSMSDLWGLIFCLSTVYAYLKVTDHQRIGWIAWGALFLGAACTVRYAAITLLAPLAIHAAMKAIQQKRPVWILAALAICLMGFLPFLILKHGQYDLLLGHSMSNKWSIANWFSRQFTNENGHSMYTLPNLIFVGSIFIHYAYWLLLPIVGFLVKKTDFLRETSRVLIIALFVFLLFHAGIPHQNLRHLIPAYTLLLILLFPAWDRYYGYGFLFFKKWATLLLVALVTGQIAGIVLILRPVWKRNQFEREIARDIKEHVPDRAVLYGFDVDIALRTYLPECTHVNLWNTVLDEGLAPGFIVFNPTQFSKQWSGHTPMQNWAFLQKNKQLTPVFQRADGWGLWVISE